MKIDVVSVDSEVWGRNVLSLSEVSKEDDLVAAEAEYLGRLRPAYVSVRLPLGDLETVHRFEKIGFSFVECQLRLLARFKTDYDVSMHDYEYTPVETEHELEDVLSLARHAITHDRFSVDPGVPAGFSGHRYEAYVRQSFARDDEQVWRLRDVRRGLTIAFRTLRLASVDECVLLLGGVRPEWKSLGIGVISSHYCFNQMRRDGIRRAITHISAGNGPVMDLEVGHFGFRHQRAYAVLRKLYD